MNGKLSEARVSIVAFTLASLVAGSPLAARQRGDIDPEAEAAIGRCISASSNGRGWLEKTLWGLRDQEGGWIGAEVANANGSHDLGPLQVNSFWVEKIARLTGRQPALVRWWLIYDPCFNVEAARWIFLSALAGTRDYWSAIGGYHSATASRARPYAAAVARHLRRRFGEEAFGTRFAPQGDRRGQ